MHCANHPKIGHYSACESGCANRDLPTLRGIVSKFKLCEQRVDEWQRTRRVWRARGAGGDDQIRYTKHLPPPTSEAPWPSLAIALMMYLISAAPVNHRCAFEGSWQVASCGQIAGGITMQNLPVYGLACACVGLPCKLRHRC